MKCTLLSMTMRHRAKLLALCLLWPVLLFGQDEKELAPVTSTYAITNVTIVQAPGRKIEKGTVVMKDGVITAVGQGVAIPADAVVIKADSMYVYAGFIDGLSHIGVTKPKDEAKEKIKDPGNPPPDKAGITPQNDVRNFLNAADKSIEEWRNIGFTVSQVVPYGNFLPGEAAVILLGGKSADDLVLASSTALYSELSGSGAANVYPNTVMAVMAKWRELYKQASLTKSYQSLYASNRVGLERPGNDRILEAFYPVIDQKVPVLFHAEKIMDIQRIFTLKNDLGFALTIAEVKEGWNIIPKIKASGAKVYLALDLPEETKKDDKKDDKAGKDGKVKKDSVKAATPKVDKPKTAGDLEREALEKRKTDAIAQYASQASAFNKAGITFGFSTLSAKSKDAQANLRRIIAGGLSEDAALAALTTTPAQLLGLGDRLGTIDNGKIANLVVSDKPYFNEKAKVRYVFVDGKIYKQETKEVKKSDGAAKASPKGNWSYTSDTPQGTSTGKLAVKDDGGNFSGTISNSFSGKDTDIKNVVVDGSTFSFAFTIDTGGNTINIEVNVKIEGDTFEGTMTAGQFGSFPIKGTRDPKK